MVQTQAAVSDSGILVRNTFVLLVRYALLWGLNGVLVLFLPRYLGDEGLGQLQFALSFVALFTVGMHFGMRQFLVKEVARNKAQVQTYMGTALGVRLVTATVVLSVIVLISQMMAFSPAAERVIYIIAGMAIFLSLTDVAGSILHGMENMTWPALGEIVNRIVVVTIGVYLLINGYGVQAYAAVLLAGAAAQFIFTSAYVVGRFPVHVNLDRKVVKTLLVGGAPFLLLTFLLQIYANVNVVMLRFFTTEAVVGWYAAAMQLYRTLDVLPLVLTTAMLPTLARVHASNLSGLVAMAKKAISAGILVIVPLSLAVSVYAGSIIRFLPYPDVFQNSAPLLTLLALSIPLTAVLTILGTIAAAADRQKAWSIALLGTVVLNVALNAFAIPYFQRTAGNGAIGAALSTNVCEAAMLMVGLRLMPKGVIDRSMILTMAKAGLAGVVAASVAFLFKSLHVEVIAALILAGTVYVALVLLSGAVTKEELRFIWSAFRHRVQANRPASHPAQEGKLLS